MSMLEKQLHGLTPIVSIEDAFKELGIIISCEDESHDGFKRPQLFIKEYSFEEIIDIANKNKLNER